MDSTLRPKEADLQRDETVVPLTPQTVTSAEELLAKLAQEAASATADRRSGTAESDFSAGPRLAAPSLDIAPRPLGTEQAASEVGSRGRRAMRGPFRFLLAACIGVVGTLAWQSYGEAGRHMVAVFVPALVRSPSPDMTPPLAGAVNEHPAAAAQASAADAAPAQTAALAQPAPDPVAPPAPAVTPAAPASAEAMQQIEGMAHDIAAMRQSMEQLTAAQSQMAGTIAALQAAQDARREDARREQPAPPPRPAAARRPVATVPPPQRAPQPLAPGPRPLSQSFTPSPGPAPPQPQPPRPPGAMP
jgi:hypothetical protein